jgi:ribosome maturation factor RimP
VSGGDQPASKSKVSQLIGQVIALLEPDLVKDGFELLDVRIFQGGGRFQVRVYVDLEEGGISLDRCTQAARTVNMLLEEADLFPGQYVIEVSSPGIRRPLRKLSHFESATGQKVELKLKPGADRSRIRGVLEAVEGQALMVRPAGKTEAGDDFDIVPVDLSSVAEGNLDPDFDAQSIINADRRRRKEDRREKRREQGNKGRKSRPKAGKTKTGDKSKADPSPSSDQD